MNRDYVNYAINPLIKFSYDKRETVNKRGLWNYIKESICDKRYLQIWLNEYYIEELEAFKKHDYYHESLIYGYDDRRKVVSIMSFHNGMPKFIKITRRSLENAWNKAYDYNHLIYGMEILPIMSEYNVDRKHIADTLQDYIEGINSSEKYKYITETDSGCFGIRIYDEIIKNEFNKKSF